MHESVSHTEAMATMLIAGMTNPIILRLWIVQNFLVSSVSEDRTQAQESLTV